MSLPSLCNVTLVTFSPSSFTNVQRFVGSGRIEIRVALRQQLLLRLFVFLNRKMVSLPPNSQNKFGRISVPAHIAVEGFPIHSDPLVLFECWSGREFIVRSVGFPFDGSESVLEQRFQNFLENSFAVAAVCQEDKS